MDDRSLSQVNAMPEDDRKLLAEKLCSLLESELPLLSDRYGRGFSFSLSVLSWDNGAWSTIEGVGGLPGAGDADDG